MPVQGKLISIYNLYNTILQYQSQIISKNDEVSTLKYLGLSTALNHANDFKTRLNNLQYKCSAVLNTS
jgi:hypothetical protein